MAVKSALSAYRQLFQLIIRHVISYLFLFARRLVLASFAGAKKGTLNIEASNGTITTLGKPPRGGPKPPLLKVHNEVFWLRVLLFGDIGFAQSYMLNEISTTTSLTPIFEFFITNNHAINTATTAGLLSFLLRRLPRNTIATARLNATSHYSLSNDMFASFLSPDMTYSAPIFLPASHPDAASDTLQAAQLRKLQYAISATRIKSTDHVLEIGTGWGSFALLAAQTTGCRVTTVTPSGEQKRFAEGRIAAAGLEGKITVVQADYRELEGLGPFDKMVSIEMIEHVGHDFLDTYFRCVDRYLKKDGGIGFFQCITIPETRYKSYLRSEDFIKKYIFPGGHLPTVSGLVGSIDRGSGGRLIVEEVKSVAAYYPRALRSWNEKFQANFENEIAPGLQKKHPEMTKVDMEIFRRKWEVSLPCLQTMNKDHLQCGVLQADVVAAAVLLLLLRSGLQRQGFRRCCDHRWEGELCGTSQRDVASTFATSCS